MSDHEPFPGEPVDPEDDAKQVRAFLVEVELYFALIIAQSGMPGELRPPDDTLALAAAMEDLPTAERAALFMRYMAQFSEAEIAKALSIPVRSVPLLMRKALEALQAGVQDQRKQPVPADIGPIVRQVVFEPLDEKSRTMSRDERRARARAQALELANDPEDLEEMQAIQEDLHGATQEADGTRAR